MPCGSCSYFDENETWGSKGHCDYLGAYVYASDSTCSHYVSRGGGGGCYMTTACCAYHGLADDCHELTAMRCLRDDYMRRTEEGQRMIADYYRTAPGIVKHIDESEERDALYDYIYGVVRNCAELVDAKCFARAKEMYQGMVDHLKAKLG